MGTMLATQEVAGPPPGPITVVSTVDETTGKTRMVIKSTQNLQGLLKDKDAVKNMAADIKKAVEECALGIVCEVNFVYNEETKQVEVEITLSSGDEDQLEEALGEPDVQKAVETATAGRLFDTHNDQVQPWIDNANMSDIEAPIGSLETQINQAGDPIRKAAF